MNLSSILATQGIVVSEFSPLAKAVLRTAGIFRFKPILPGRAKATVQAQYTLQVLSMRRLVSNLSTV